MRKRFSLSYEGFIKSLNKGLLRLFMSSFDYVDIKRYCDLLDAYLGDKNRIKVPSTLTELEKRMSKDYYRKVFQAQTEVMNYSSTLFPSYSFIMSEDLVDDWLATVDVHKKYARDHSLHQPMTAYIVAVLLGYGDPSKALKIPAKPNDLLSYCTDCIITSCDYLRGFAKDMGIPDHLLENTTQSFRFWMDMFYQTAILSALFHDIGYPWQYLGRVGYSLGESSQALQPCIANLPLIIDRYKDRLLLLPFRKYVRYLPGQPAYVMEEMKMNIEKAMGTHGLPGGIAFIELNDAIRCFPCSSLMGIVHDFSVEWASMGIIMHDMANLHKKHKCFRIDFKKDPLSSIVSIADYLEEFQRPSVSFTNRKKSSDIEYDYTCKRVNLSVNGDVLEVQMVYNSPGQMAAANDFKKEETDIYFDPISGFIDMSSIGINSVKYLGVV